MTARILLASAILSCGMGLSGAPVQGGGAEMMQTPWKSPPRRLTLEQYIGTLYYYAEKAPGKFRLEKRGESPKGLPVYLAVMTDRAVPDEEKNVILLTAFHSGAERTATAGLLELMEWLMGDSPLAKESLRKNIVLMMPVCNPEGFFLMESSFNSRRFDPYSASRGDRLDLNTLLPKDPSSAPEYMAYRSVADEYMPDFHLDVHGTGLHFNAHIQPMSVGRAGSNSSLAPWDRTLQGEMMSAGSKAGFGVIDFGTDSQRLAWGPAMGKNQEAFCEMGQPYFYSAMYGYFKYHTMISTLESTWTFSVTEPVKELLRLANRGFSSGPVGDFAVNTIKTSFTCQLESYGKTRAERRRNRAALWQKQSGFAVGMSYPNTSNFMLCAVAYGKEGILALTGRLADSGRWGQVSFPDLLKSVKTLSYIDEGDLTRFLSFAPPEVRRVLFEKAVSDPAAPEPPLTEGISVRLPLPVTEVDLLELKVNGHPVKESPTDGYQVWEENGFTNVRINIPPERTAKEKLFLISCAWNPRRDLASKYGWLPNDGIRKWIQSSLNKSQGAADWKKAEEIYGKFKADGGKYR